MAKRSKAIMHIIKRFDGKRLKKIDKWDPARYEFPTHYAASQACWIIQEGTGRECIAVGKVLTMYT